MFAAHCQPKKNLVYERYGFITKRQEEGESFSCLVTDLKQRAASCDFGELRDSMIVMMIIVALRCGKLKDKMLKEAGLTLVKAITMGRTNELTQRQMKVMHPAETGAIATVAAKKPRAAQPSASGATGGGHQNGRQPYRQRQAGRGNNNQAQGGNDYECIKCGSRHKPRMCPAFKATCIICKKIGHYARKCNAKVNIVEAHYDNDDEQSHHDDMEEREFFVHTVNVRPLEQTVLSVESAKSSVTSSAGRGMRTHIASNREGEKEEELRELPDVNKPGVNKHGGVHVREVRVNTDQRWTHPLLVNGQIVVVKLDTGAAANLLSERDYHALTERPKLHKAGIRLTDYNNKVIESAGGCIVECQGNAGRIRLRFIVVKEGPSLLGYEACEKLFLVRRIFNTQEMQRVFRVCTVNEYTEEVARDVRECTLPEVNSKLSSIL